MVAPNSPRIIEFEEIMPRNGKRKEGVEIKEDLAKSKRLLKKLGYEIEELSHGIYGDNPQFGLTKKGKPRRYLLNTDGVKCAALFAVVLSLEKNF